MKPHVVSFVLPLQSLTDVIDVCAIKWPAVRTVPTTLVCTRRASRLSWKGVKCCRRLRLIRSLLPSRVKNLTDHLKDHFSSHLTQWMVSSQKAEQTCIRNSSYILHVWRRDNAGHVNTFNQEARMVSNECLIFQAGVLADNICLIFRESLICLPSRPQTSESCHVIEHHLRNKQTENLTLRSDAVGLHNFCCTLL